MVDELITSVQAASLKVEVVMAADGVNKKTRVAFKVSQAPASPSLNDRIKFYLSCKKKLEIHPESMLESKILSKVK